MLINLRGEMPPPQAHCAGCGKELEEWRSADVAYQITRLRREWRRDGFCYGCGRKPDPGHATCSPCREKERLRKQAWRAKAA